MKVEWLSWAPRTFVFARFSFKEKLFSVFESVVVMFGIHLALRTRNVCISRVYVSMLWFSPLSERMDKVRIPDYNFLDFLQQVC